MISAWEKQKDNERASENVLNFCYEPAKDKLPLRQICSIYNLAFKNVLVGRERGQITRQLQCDTGSRTV